MPHGRRREVRPTVCQNRRETREQEDQPIVRLLHRTGVSRVVIQVPMKLAICRHLNTPHVHDQAVAETNFMHDFGEFARPFENDRHEICGRCVISMARNFR